MTTRQLAEGATGEAELVVTPGMTAARLGADPGDAFPEVFATAAMVGLMELAASRAMKPLLESGELSVGVEVCVTHTAPTAVGSRVRARGTYRGSEGKLFLFDVVAEDEGGEIGRGTHKRAIVAAQRLVAGAERRRRPPGP